MTLDLAAPNYVKQLRRAGLRPGERLAHNITASGDAAVAPLLELATTIELLEAEPPERYGPLHALRLLGELRPVRVIAPLLDELPLDVEGTTDAVLMWERELPQILGRIGRPAVETLWEYADDEGRDPIGRGAALVALAYVTAVEPELRDEIAGGLRARLARSEQAEQNAYLVMALADMGFGAAYAEVMARYRTGSIDQETMPAATARQLLLSPGDERLACARHPLWERYDEHGPFPPEQEDVG